MSQTFRTAASVAVAFAAICASGLAVSALWAQVLRDLWGWFIAPAWGLGLLDFRTAFGLLLVAHVFTQGRALLIPDDGDNHGAGYLFAYRLLVSALGAVLTWIVGAVIAGVA